MTLSIKGLFVFFALIVFINSQAASMAGTYTIGTNASDNFATIGDCIDSLESNGVSGAVLIKINAGSFNERLEITAIPGASSTNTITFKGKGNTTVIKYSATSSNRAVVSLKGVSHIIFDSLRIESNGSYGIAFNYWADADSITVKNCEVYLNNSSSTYNCAGFANYSSLDGTGASTTKSLVITNNKIENGYEGIRLIGNSSSANKHRIDSNTISNFGNIGIHVSGTVDVLVRFNNLYSNQADTRCAISMWPTGHTISVLSNKARLSSDADHTRVFQIANAPGGGGSSWAEAVLVANNMVIYDGTFSSNMTGIYTKHVSYLRIYNNSVYMPVGSGAKPLWLDALSATGPIDVLNNNLMTDVANGQTIRVHPLVSASADYNNHFNSAGFNAVWGSSTYTSLSSYISGASQGANSVAINPQIIDSINLHIDTTNYQFKGLGSPISYISTDIDGDTRHSTKPDIGADEFNAQVELSLGAFTAPNDCRSPNPTVGISVWIKNLNSFAVSNIPISYKINSGSLLKETYTGSIAANDSVNYTFFNRAFLMNTGQYVITAFLDLKADLNTSNDTSIYTFRISNLASSLSDKQGACINESVYLDAGSNAGASYLWSDGSTAQTTTVSSTIAQDTVYIVKITDSRGCSISDSVSVIFSTPAQLELGMDTTLCIDEQLILDVTVTNATYKWKDGSTDSIFTINTPGNYKVDVETGYNCIVSDSIQVDYRGMIDFSLGDQIALCTNESVIVGVLDTFSTYQWQDGSTDSSFEINGAGIYWLEASDRFGCAGRDSVTVSALEIPVLDLGADTSICDGNTILFDATTPNCSYNWNKGPTSAQITANTEGKYQVEVTNAQGCSTIDSIYLEINALPVVNLGEDDNFCQGTHHVLNAFSEGASYQWNDQSDSFLLTVKQTGIYWVELTDSNGCVAADSITLTVLPHKNVKLGNDASLGLSSIQTNSFVIDAGTGYSSYLWYDNSNNQTLEIDGDYTIGQYEVWVKVETSNGCASSDTMNVTVYDNASISNPSLTQLNIYPNPTNGVFYLSGTNINGAVTFELINVLGQKIEQGEVDAIDNSITKRFDLTTNTHGMYYLMLQAESFSKTFKIVVE